MGVTEKKADWLVVACVVLLPTLTFDQSQAAGTVLRSARFRTLSSGPRVLQRTNPALLHMIPGEMKTDVRQTLLVLAGALSSVCVSLPTLSLFYFALGYVAYGELTGVSGSLKRD